MIDTEEPQTWPTFVTVPEAAEILRVSKMTVYRMIHRGQFDSPDSEPGAIHVGRSFRIRSSALRRVADLGTEAA
jgi:excisionase family DNA binding protein